MPGKHSFPEIVRILANIVSYLVLFFLLSFFETGFHYIAHVGFKLAT
jgi:hypothetical protein